MGDYRKLRVWKAARKLTNRAYDVTETFPDSERYGLRAQIRRASVSIMANIAEGCGRNRDRELARFLYISKSSAGELECHLTAAFDRGLLERKEAVELGDAVDHVQRMLALLIRQLPNA